MPPTSCVVATKKLSSVRMAYDAIVKLSERGGSSTDHPEEADLKDRHEGNDLPTIVSM